MSDLTAVTRELDALERIQADLAAVATRTDDARRGDLVNLRRLLSAQIGTIGQIAEPIFANAPGDHAQFRRLYSAMRSAAALHQAAWPAIRLGEMDARYRDSARGVRAANRTFVEWLRGKLSTMPR